MRAAMETMGRDARHAAAILREASAEQRSAAIAAAAIEIRRRQEAILAANREDVAGATALVDRLMLDDERAAAMADAVAAIAGLPDPLGAEMERWRRPNGLDIARVRTPIGVIGMIYESRPNVTADAAAICLRSGNAVILRAGSEALRSALAIHEAIAAGLAEAGLPAACVQIVATADREAVGLMLEGLGGTIDLLIPQVAGRTRVARGAGAGARPSRGRLPHLCPPLGRSGDGGGDRRQCQAAPRLRLRRDRDSADRCRRRSVAAAAHRRRARRLRVARR
jgi:glutamate-5-semialdehyde dehydrogenase